MGKRVIILNFDVASKAYQAFSEIKKLHTGRQLKGEQMAVVTHDNDGTHKFKIDDFIDLTGANNSSKDSLIGMIIGVFVSPIAMLLGWFAGSMIGGYKDVKEVTDANSVFQQVINSIHEGETGVILIAEETDNRPLNQLIFSDLGAQITRLDYETVEDELKEAQKLEKEVKKQAQDTWKEHKPSKEIENK